MTLVFYPGRKPRFQRVYTYNIYREYSVCNCIQERVDNIKSGYNDPSQPENRRISRILTNNLGGRTTYGNFGIPVEINFLGRKEGHPGGSLKPIRNKF